VITTALVGLDSIAAFNPCNKPWTITTAGTIRIQCGNKSERLNIRRVIPFTNKIVL
jgi:hypothetical protein